MLLPDYFEFMCPVKTGSGNKALEHLPVDLDALDARKPLIVTDKQTQAKGLIKNIIKAFRDSGLVLGVYDGVNENSGLDTVKELNKIYLDKGFDSIIAVGSGKSVDVAKVLNIVVSGKPEDLKTCVGKDKIATPLKPFVFIPVSSGTGRDTAGEAILENMVFSSKFLMPNLVVIDPRMLKEEKPDLVINTAMAALTQAAEVYSSPGNNPFVGTYAHTTINFVMSNLLNVVKNSLDEKGRLKTIIGEFQDKDGRIALANAASMSGCVSSNAPEGVAQKLGMEVSRNCSILPGIAMGVILPYVLEFNAYRKGQELEKIMLPVAGLDVYCSTPVGQRFESAVGKIRHLQNELYLITSAVIPRTLEDANMSKENLSAIAVKVAGDDSVDYDTDALLMILEHAFDGKPVTP